ncbi:GyrI-like domain-containing protein [Anaerotignum sp.]|uniref:GyrI-like domain-containing protein n=1 Tax=Anaerotignum sp. TaxID=2039241 RepID=UPI0027154879|nr:GyrI-like domain-containing protein [Anaerotignum sp.]
MEYEVVQLKEKKLAGIRIRTSNDDPKMSRQIGKAWERFFGEGIFQGIPNKKNEKTIGLYTNYEDGVKGKYDVMICCEVEGNIIPSDKIETQIIPAGKYAEFIVRGHVQKAVQEFWMKLWAMDLDRKYGCDFEEYQAEGDMENAEIHFFISLN